MVCSVLKAVLTCMQKLSRFHLFRRWNFHPLWRNMGCFSCIFCQLHETKFCILCVLAEPHLWSFVYLKIKIATCMFLDSNFFYTFLSFPPFKYRRVIHDDIRACTLLLLVILFINPPYIFLALKQWCIVTNMIRRKQKGPCLK